MDIQRFEELENRIEEKSFIKANSGKAKLWLLAGIFFQTLNIGICFLGLYWFLSRLFPVFPGNSFVFGVVSLILLIFWEFLKRSTVLEVATKLLKTSFSVSRNQLASIFLAVFLISGSGYMAIRGANEIADTSQQVETTANTQLAVTQDSVGNQYDKRIAALELLSQNYVALAAEKGRPMNRRETAQVETWDAQAKELKQERDEKLSALEQRFKTTVDHQKEGIQGNSLAFLMMTLGIESIILFCIAYGAKFDFSSYQEASNDIRFHQHRLHLFLLKTVYQDGRQKEGADCMATTRLEEIVKIKRGGSVGTSEIKAFYTLMNTYEVTKTRGSKRMFLKDYPKAIEAFQENYS